MVDKGEQYICGSCGGTFTAGRSHGEALAEMRGNFGEVPPEDQVIICDACYAALMQWAKETL